MSQLFPFVFQNLKELMARTRETPRNGPVDFPLHIAAQTNDLEKVNQLLESGKCNVTDVWGTYSPLMLAARHGHMGIVKRLVEAGAPLDQENQYGTPIHLACQEGHVDIVKFLTCIAMEAGDDDTRDIIINAKAGENEETCLHVACQQGSLDIVKHLVEECNANMNSKRFDGKIPNFVIYFQ